MNSWLIKLFDKFHILSLCCFDASDSEEEYINLLKKRINSLITEFNDCVSHQQKLQNELEKVRTLIENAKRKQHLKDIQDIQMSQNKKETAQCGSNCKCN
jgi:hypothetical protein